MKPVGTNIIVTIGNENVRTINLENTKGDIFKFAFEEKTISDIKYINIGEKGTLNFKNKPPDKITITDSLINSKGQYIYPDKLTREVPVTIENDNYNFKIENSIASAYSSFSIENQTVFRGYKIITYQNKKEYVYAFVIKTKPYWCVYI